jgi:hypothetical protein
MLRKKQKDSENSRRRPAPTGRTGNFSYYTQSRSSRTINDQPVARRQPIPRDKAEIARYVGQRFGVILAVIAALALLVSSLQVSMTPRIKILNDGSVYRVHSNEAYEEGASHTLRSSWTNTNKITINTSMITGDLRSEFPEIAEASIVLPVLGQRPILYLQLTRPSLVLVTSAGSAYVLDETGRVLAPAAQVDNLDSFKLPTILDQSGLEPKTGRLVLSSSTVSFITSVLYQLQKAGVQYTTLTLPASSQELDVGLTGRNYIVKFNTHAATAREQAGSYLAVQANLDKAGKSPAEYIDARLPGRVYIK